LIVKLLSHHFLERVQNGNGTHRILAYANDVNLLGDSIDTIKKNIGTLIDDSEEVDLETNIEKTKYMLLCHHQKAAKIVT
jgi:hypothetical protein